VITLLREPRQARDGGAIVEKMRKVLLEAEAPGRKPETSAKFPTLEAHPILGNPKSLKGRVRTDR